MLQHPERVIPLSECERFEPHFQPNVALAPIPAPTMISPSVQRRHHYERRHAHRSSSPDEKQEELLSTNVKLEKTSPSQTTGSYAPLYFVSEDDQKEAKKEEKEGEEEESSAAVTSSTVNVEPAPGAGEVGTSSPESDSDGNAAAVDLEERLMALEVPQDVLELARRVVLENAQLRRHRRSDAREISRLRSQLHTQKQSGDEPKEDATTARAAGAAADSTEGSEETDASLPSNNKEPAVLATNNESEQ